MRLALRLKRLRKARGLTKAAASLDYPTHDPRVGTLRKFAKALGVPVAEPLG